MTITCLFHLVTEVTRRGGGKRGKAGPASKKKQPTAAAGSSGKQGGKKTAPARREIIPDFVQAKIDAAKKEKERRKRKAAEESPSEEEESGEEWVAPPEEQQSEEDDSFEEEEEEEVVEKVPARGRRKGGQSKAGKKGAKVPKKEAKATMDSASDEFRRKSSALVLSRQKLVQQLKTNSMKASLHLTKMRRSDPHYQAEEDPDYLEFSVNDSEIREKIDDYNEQLFVFDEAPLNHASLPFAVVAAHRVKSPSDGQSVPTKPSPVTGTREDVPQGVEDEEDVPGAQTAAADAGSVIPEEEVAGQSVGGNNESDAGDSGAAVDPQPPVAVAGVADANPLPDVDEAEKQRLLARLEELGLPPYLKPSDKEDFRNKFSVPANHPGPRITQVGDMPPWEEYIMDKKYAAITPRPDALDLWRLFLGYTPRKLLEEALEMAYEFGPDPDLNLSLDRYHIDWHGLPTVRVSTISCVTRIPIDLLDCTYFP